MKKNQKKIYSMKSLTNRKVGKDMKCSHCGKDVTDISFLLNWEKDITVMNYAILKVLEKILIRK